MRQHARPEHRRGVGPAGSAGDAGRALTRLDVTDPFELLGVLNAARARDIARARHDRSGPDHPDFASDESTPAVDAAIDGESISSCDADVDFASVRQVVDRMRAAFFTGRS